MGERKGTNLYYPPDYDPSKGGLNKFLGTHPLRERAKKIGMGILIIRFEMPFNIWCNGCGNHIGMGVRYNAEKKKVGDYLTTPIWNFRMKCHLCDNYIGIRTEPKANEYVVVSGARRQENRWDPKENEQITPEDKETSKRLYDDAMFKLEHGYGDKRQADSLQSGLTKLTRKRERLWHDDYAANCALRQQFREERKELQKKDAKEPESEEEKKDMKRKYVQKKMPAKRERQTTEWSSMSCFDEKSSSYDVKGPSKYSLSGLVRKKARATNENETAVSYESDVSESENNNQKATTDTLTQSKSTHLSHEASSSNDDNAHLASDNDSSPSVTPSANCPDTSISLVSPYYDSPSSDEN